MQLIPSNMQPTRSDERSSWSTLGLGLACSALLLMVVVVVLLLVYRVCKVAHGYDGAIS